MLLSMSDDDTTPRVLACNLGITLVPGSLEPMLVFSYRLANQKDDVDVLMSGPELEALLPSFVEVLIRLRTLTEMLTLYPENRDEILRNIMFRWTGTVLADGEDVDG